MSSSGQVIHTLTVQGITGNNHQSMGLAELPNGVYYVTIYCKEGNFTKAIMKQ